MLALSVTHAMTKSGLSQSIRKFIRKEKSRIKRETLNTKEQEILIAELYKKFINLNKKQK